MPFGTSKAFGHQLAIHCSPVFRALLPFVLTTYLTCSHRQVPSLPSAQPSSSTFTRNPNPTQSINLQPFSALSSSPQSVHYPGSDLHHSTCSGISIERDYHRYGLIYASLLISLLTAFIAMLLLLAVRQPFCSYILSYCLYICSPIQFMKGLAWPIFV